MIELEVSHNRLEIETGILTQTSYSPRYVCHSILNEKIHESVLGKRLNSLEHLLLFKRT